MGEIPGYDNDIFISYSRKDNAQIGSIRWIDKFSVSLENWLGQTEGFEKLTIWRDTDNLRGNTLFDDEIKKTLKSSALLFVLNSKNYLKSDYCKKELEWFQQFNQDRPGGLKFGTHSRIFNILLNNIPPHQWPEPLHGTTAFEMHGEEGKINLSDENLFIKQLGKVVNDVEAALQDLSKNEPLPEVEEREPQEVRIFLSRAADTLDDFRERIITESEVKQAKTLAEIPPPMEYEAHKETVNQTLEQAHLSIHLFDDLSAPKIRGHKQTTYPREQFEIAVKNEKVKKLVWVPGALDFSTVSDETQRNFLKNLSDRDRKASDYELIQGTKTKFINVLRKEIDDIHEKLKQPSKKNLTACTYLINTHKKDQSCAYELAACLAKKGMDVDITKELGEPSERLDEFEKSVKKAKNLIIIFGIVEGSWLKARITTAFKIAIEQLTRDGFAALDKIWVYMTPECTGEISLKFPQFIQIEILNQNRAQAIDAQEIAKLLPPAISGVSQ